MSSLHNVVVGPIALRISDDNREDVGKILPLAPKNIQGSAI
jgi:hypothetical protein